MESDFATLRFCIVGLGLIGGSFAKALRKEKAGAIYAVDVNEAALKEALKDGVIDEGDRDGRRFLSETDILIICLDGDVEMRWIAGHADDFPRGLLLTDVAGIKRDMPERIQALLPEGVEFLAGHPMAGREGAGYAMADASIFKGANYLLVPTEKNSDSAVERVTQLAKKLGCAAVTAMDSRRHDALISYVSHLPHALATALINSDSFQDDVKRAAAGSFRDATRVADINDASWAKLFMENRDNLLREIHRFQSSLSRLSCALERGDEAVVRTFLKEAGERKRSIQ